MRAFEQAVSSERGQEEEGSFLGGLLTARFGGAGLRAHVKEFLSRLDGIDIEGSSDSLFVALLFIAACHGVGIPGIDETVLADLLAVPHNQMYRRVVRPLGEEAAAVRSAGRVFTRHSKVARAVLVEADPGLGADLPEVWGELVSPRLCIKVIGPRFSWVEGVCDGTEVRGNG